MMALLVNLFYLCLYVAVICSGLILVVGILAYVTSPDTYVQRNKFRRATKEDYDKWLTKHLENGGEPSSYHNGPMCPESSDGILETYRLKDFWVATQDFRMKPFHGVFSMKIFVPEGINCKGKEFGGNTIYMMEDGTYEGSSKSLCAYNDSDVPGIKTVERDVLPHLRPATDEEVSLWMESHRRHSRPRDLMVATEDFELLPMWGSSLLEILVPAGIEVTGSDIGANRLYEA